VHGTFAGKSGNGVPVALNVQLVAQLFAQTIAGIFVQIACVAGISAILRPWLLNMQSIAQEIAGISCKLLAVAGKSGKRALVALNVQPIAQTIADIFMQIACVAEESDTGGYWSALPLGALAAPQTPRQVFQTREVMACVYKWGCA
jgi:hypothetical protein